MLRIIRGRKIVNFRAGKDRVTGCLPPHGAERHSTCPMDQFMNQRGSAAAPCRKIALELYHSICACGFAAAQCGKALPFRRLLSFEAAPQLGGVASSNFGDLTVRQSLTALCGGKAAVAA